MIEFTKDPRFDTPKLHEFPIKGQECAYFYVSDPDTAFNDSKWKVTIFLDEVYEKKMRAVGFNVKIWGQTASGAPKKDRKESKYNDRAYIQVTRKTHMQNGDPMFPPKVYGPDGQSYWDRNVAIGNGSICNIQVAGKYMQMKGETILPCYLQALQVVKHVEYSKSPFGNAQEEAEL